MEVVNLVMGKTARLVLGIVVFVIAVIRPVIQGKPVTIVREIAGHVAGTAFVIWDSMKIVRYAGRTADGALGSP